MVMGWEGIQGDKYWLYLSFLKIMHVWMDENEFTSDSFLNFSFKIGYGFRTVVEQHQYCYQSSAS